MKRILRSQLRSLWGSKLVGCALILSLSLGVMSVLTVHELGTRIVGSVELNNLSSGYDYVVRLHEQGESGYFQLRRQWRRGELAEVVAVMPVIEGVLPTQGGWVQLLGIDPLADLPIATQLLDVELDQRTFLTQDQAATFATGADSKVVYDSLEVIAASQSHRSYVLTDIATAQDVLNRRGELDAVWLRTGGTKLNPWFAKLLPGVHAGWNRHLQIPTIDGFTVSPMDAWNPAQHFNGAIAFCLGILSVLASMVAGFIFFQTVRINQARRERELVRLKTLGVSNAQLTLANVSEATILGILGCFVGALLAIGFLSTLPEANVVSVWDAMSSWGLAKALSLGLLTPIGAALLASRLSRKQRAMQVIAFLTAGILLTLVGFAPNSGLIGAFLLILALCFLSMGAVVPAALRGLQSLARHYWWGSRIHRMVVRSGIDTVHTTRLTMNAFTIAIATAIGISVMVESFRADFEVFLERRVTPGLHLSDANNVDLERWLGTPGLESISTYLRAPATTPSGPVDVVAIDWTKDELERYGAAESVPHGVLVNEVAQRRFGIGIGDSLPLVNSSTETERFNVVHVFNDFGSDRMRAVVPKSVWTSGFFRDRVTLRGTESALDSLEESISRTYPEVQATRGVSLRAVAVSVFDTTFTFTTLLANIATFVAVLGLASALIILQSRRDIEARLLHGIGVSKMQLTIGGVAECSVIGAIAVVCALPLAISIAWALCELIMPRAFGWAIDLKFSLEPFAFPAALAIAASIVAGVIPLRRALARVLSQPVADTN